MGNSAQKITLKVVGTPLKQKLEENKFDVDNYTPGTLVIDEKEPYMIFEAYRQQNNKTWGKDEALVFVDHFISALESREKKRFIEKKLSKEEIIEFETAFKTLREKKNIFFAVVK